MSNCRDNGSLRESLRQLQETQLVVGQSAFNAINEHDKLMQLIRELMAEADEMFGSMDMVNMEIAALLGEAGLDEEQKDSFSQMNDQNAIIAGKLLCRLQDVLVEAEVGSQTIHRMEEDIALAQDAMDLLREAADGLP